MWRASASRPAGTESSRSKMHTSDASLAALRSRAASVPGVNRALRMRDRGSAMAKCAAVSQVIDLDGAITRGSKDHLAIAVQRRRRPIHRREAVHRDRQTDGLYLAQDRVMIGGEHRPVR